MLSRLRVAVFLCVFVLFAAGGCGRESKLPTAGPSREAVSSSSPLEQAAARVVESQDGFFPLELGNRWHYVYTYSTQFLPADGSRPEPPIVGSTTTELRLVCIEGVDGRSYVAQRGTYKSGTRAYWTLFRQDRTGLYELQRRSLSAPTCDAAPLPAASDGAWEFRAVDQATWGRRIDGVHGTLARDAIRRASPILEARLEGIAASLGFGGPAAARRGAVGPVDHEATRLRYPLHPGSTWEVYAPPFPSLTASVEGVDLIRLPDRREPAYRIRYVSDAIDPGATVHVWYGRSGYLGSRARSSYVIADSSGHAYGTVVAEWSDVLDSISLVAPSGRR
jgi:hypothetical protein